jgi:hypothetical protein
LRHSSRRRQIPKSPRLPESSGGYYAAQKRRGKQFCEGVKLPFTLTGFDWA